MATNPSVTPQQIEHKFGHVQIDDLIRCIPLDQALADFSKLCAAPPALGMHRLGMKANEHFAASEVFKAYRILQHNGVARPTIRAVWASPRHKAKLFETAARLFRAKTIDDIHSKHILTSYKLQHGSVSLFRPMVAKYLFTRYSPRGRVLDFCAGWGGRLLGALATPHVTSYVGIDSNSDMTPVYAAMAQLSTGTRVETICAPAETLDFGDVGPYDCVVTSPPYYGIEVYRHMPGYASYEEWIETFFYAVLRKITRHIDQDGTIIINIRQPRTEELMVAEMGRLGWGVAETLNYRLSAMPGKGCRKAVKDYGEPIYVFKKVP